MPAKGTYFSLRQRKVSKRKRAPILCYHVAAVQARPYCNDLFVPQSYYNGCPGLNASAAMGIV